MAFDALRSIGITDVAGFAALLTNENSDIAGLAAELVPGLPNVPEPAVALFMQALKSQSEPVRIAAAEGLSHAGTKAGPAAIALAEVIKTTYPPEYEPNTVIMLGSDLAYWRALGQIGEPAVAPLAGLLAHTNAVVRGMAAQTLGELGPCARPTATKLKDALKDKFAFVAIEAACALARIGEGTADAVELIKRAIDAPNNVARTAIEAIPRMGAAGKPLVELALKKLSDKENSSARFAAIGLIEGLPPGEAMLRAADLGRLVTDEIPEIRQRAAFVLERLGPIGSAAAKSLGEALATDKDESLRDQVVDALLAMGPGAKPALPALLHLAADSTLPVSRREKLIAAIVAADPASPMVATTLIVIAGDSDASLRAAAATALGQLDPLSPDAILKLVALTKTDKRTEPRAAALCALAEAGPRAKSARREIQAIAAGTIQDGQAFLARLAIAAMDGETAKAATIVHAGLTDNKADLRASAASALIRLGPKPDDFPALMRLLNDRDGSTREAAAKCLGRLGPVAKEAVLRLTKLLTDDATSDVRIAAATALGDIGPAALAAIPKLKQAARTDRVVEPAARKALEKLGVKDRP
jgi:HEAT repeat protein